MKKIILFLLLFIPFFVYSEDKIPVTLFYSSHCKACFDVKDGFLPGIKSKYAAKLEWKEVNVDEDAQGLALLYSLARQLRGEEARYPAVFIGSVLLTGAEEITQNLDEAISASLRKKTGFSALPQQDLVEMFKALSVFTVIGAGLVDGVNPCAFAVIIFFVSFLSVYGYRRRDLIYVGAFYCLAVFIAYLLIGLGVFKFLYAFMGFYRVIKLFYYFIALFCFSLAGLSVYDYFKLRKEGSSQGLIMQLPKIIKKKINTIIGSRLRRQKTRRAAELAASSFVIGFLVSLLEAVCTGQVYIPTIVFILKNTNLRLKALTYLVVYNVMFILPLIIVFSLSFWGVTSQKFNEFLKRNLRAMKIIMALVFCLLGIVIIMLT